MSELGLFRLKKKRLRVNFISAYKYLKGGCKEDGAMLFSVVPSVRTRGDVHKLEHKWCSGITLTVWVMEYWHRLCRGIVKSPSW